MKNRAKQRENRKLKRETSNVYVSKYLINRIKDLTPYNADRLMHGGSTKDIVLK